MRLAVALAKAFQMLFFLVGVLGLAFSIAFALFLPTLPAGTSVAPAVYAGVVFVGTTSFCAVLGGVLFSFISAKTFRQIFFGLLVTCAIADPIGLVIFARSISVNVDAVSNAMSNTTSANTTAVLVAAEEHLMGFRAGGVVFSLCLLIVSVGLLAVLQRFRKDDHDDPTTMSVWDEVGLKNIHRTLIYGRTKTKREKAVEDKDLELQSAYYVKSAEAVKVARERRNSKLEQGGAGGSGEKGSPLARQGSVTLLKLGEKGQSSTKLKDIAKSSRGSIVFGIEVYPNYWSEKIHFPLVRRVPVEEARVLSGIQAAVGENIVVSRVVRLENTRSWREYWSCRNIVGARAIAEEVRQIGEQESVLKRRNTITLRERMQALELQRAGRQPNSARADEANQDDVEEGEDGIGVSAAKLELGETKNMHWLTEEISVDANERYLFAVLSPDDIKEVTRSGFCIDDDDEESGRGKGKRGKGKGSEAELEGQGDVMGKGLYLFGSLVPFASRAKMNTLRRLFRSPTSQIGRKGAHDSKGKGESDAVIQVLYCRVVLGRVKNITADVTSQASVEDAKHTVDGEVGLEVSSQLYEREKTRDRSGAFPIREKPFHSAMNVHAIMTQSSLLRKSANERAKEDREEAQTRIERKRSRSSRRSTSAMGSHEGTLLIQRLRAYAEFMVRNPAQIYPEYIVTIEYGGDSK